MKTKKYSKPRHTSLFSVALSSLIFFGLAPVLEAQDAKTNSPAADPNPSVEQATAAVGNKQQSNSTNSTSTVATAKPMKPAAKQLTGAELYSMHCARCHPERYPNERTAAQWKTVAMHMRVRANLPAEQFRKLLKYLQDNSGY
jgi:cytoskeletal protein RodZ